MPGIDRCPDGTGGADTHSNYDGDIYCHPDLHCNLYSDLHLDRYPDPDCHLHRHPDPYSNNNLYSQSYTHPNMDANTHFYRNIHSLGNEYAFPASHQHTDRKPIRYFYYITLIQND